MSEQNVVPCGIHYDCDYRLCWKVGPTGSFLEPIDMNSIGAALAQAWRLKVAAQELVSSYMSSPDSHTDGWVMVSSESRQELLDAIDEAKEVIPWKPPQP